ncbi:hypothetical protein F4806DRAFT_506694 [Annulohypoxylon nitens]|nr:hypothetical protein F4806DRAFT_506694 [Annulohypoxylon nitens]
MRLFAGWRQRGSQVFLDLRAFIRNLHASKWLHDTLPVEQELCDFCEKNGITELLQLVVESDEGQPPSNTERDPHALRVVGGSSAEKQVGLGTMTEIKARDCPFCEIVAHILVPELAGLPIIAAVDKAGSGGPIMLPGSNIHTGDYRERLFASAERRLFIAVQKDSSFVSLGLIRCYEVSPQGYVRKAPNIDRHRDPCKEKSYEIRLGVIKTLVAQFNDIIKVNAYIEDIEDQKFAHKFQSKAMTKVSKKFAKIKSKDDGTGISDGYRKFADVLRKDSQYQDQMAKEYSFGIILIDVEEKC